jgi:hypothetical protein
VNRRGWTLWTVSRRGCTASRGSWTLTESRQGDCTARGDAEQQAGEAVKQTGEARLASNYLCPCSELGKVAAVDAVN